MTGNAQGNGNATVSFSAAPASAPRVGRITVADQTNATGRGLPAAAALRVRGDGSQVYESIARFDMQRNEFVAVPIDLSNANEQVFLILFGTGFRNRLSLNDVNVTLGNQTLAPLFAGAQGDLVGLDQVNLRLPASLRGSGNVNLTLNVEGKTSNTVTFNVR